jgi:hypothetical protein
MARPLFGRCWKERHLDRDQHWDDWSRSHHANGVEAGEFVPETDAHDVRAAYHHSNRAADLAGEYPRPPKRQLMKIQN